MKTQDLLGSVNYDERKGKLIKNSLKKRWNERYLLEKQLKNIRSEIYSVLSSTDKYIILHLIDQTVQEG